MVDRVSASITIGGMLSPDHLPEFLTLITDEDLSLDWDGEPFDAARLVSGVPLILMAHEVAQGQFSRLEDFCVARGLPFRRWCGGCHSWGPQRAVFDGQVDVAYLPVDEDDDVMLSREAITGFGSIEAILTWFDAADLVVPPLVIGVNAWEVARG